MWTLTACWGTVDKTVGAKYKVVLLHMVYLSTCLNFLSEAEDVMYMWWLTELFLYSSHDSRWRIIIAWALKVFRCILRTSSISFNFIRCEDWWILRMACLEACWWSIYFWLMRIAKASSICTFGFDGTHIFVNAVRGNKILLSTQCIRAGDGDQHF